MSRYDEIGVGYSLTRREDPRLRSLIHSALGSAGSVLNVGAGTGSYEPRDRFVVAVDPSWVMLGQRADGGSSSVLGTSSTLPFPDDAFDASMAILTIHHWDDELGAGLREIRRATRGPVVIVTYDVHTIDPMWLPRDYMPEAAALDAATFPTIAEIEGLLGGITTVTAVPVDRGTPDWTFASFWAHPERVLDPVARSGTSAFARQPDVVVDRVVSSVERDLLSGEWDRRNGHLRHLDSLDVGLRLVVATP